MRSLLLIGLLACGGTAQVPVQIRVVNEGPRAELELSGTLGEAPLNGTAFIEKGGAIEAQREAYPGDVLKLGVAFTSGAGRTDSLDLPRTVTPDGGLLVTVTRAEDAGVSFAP